MYNRTPYFSDCLNATNFQPITGKQLPIDVLEHPQRSYNQLHCAYVTVNSSVRCRYCLSDANSDARTDAFRSMKHTVIVTRILKRLAAKAAAHEFHRKA